NVESTPASIERRLPAWPFSLSAIVVVVHPVTPMPSANTAPDVLHMNVRLCMMPSWASITPRHYAPAVRNAVRSRTDYASASKRDNVSSA
ncbi:hypothetical protein, partial [Burkholderia multivorans]|uniref:hypothetical protein n=1 Tax=Burkholderia multivorans TaxID=87883 RepID=UPI001C658DF7